MAERKKSESVRGQPHRRSNRDNADNRPTKGQPEQPSAERTSEAARFEADESFHPDRDGTGF
jgi:chromatin remodeling complex protein RSC6